MLKQYWRGRVLMHGIALLTLFSVAAPTLMAHHGWGGYRDEEFEIRGVVETPVSTAGPHASLTIKVEGKIWKVVLAPPARTERAGLNAATIPVGAQVTAYGHRHRDPQTLEVKTERLRWKDRVFNVYPDRT